MEDYLMMQQIETHLAKALAPLNEKISSLNEELDSLRSELATAKSAQQFSAPAAPVTQVQEPAAPAQPVQQPLQQAPVQQQTVNPHAQPAPQAATEAIDRNGVSPNSVSIEKMFYCGNR